MKINPEQHDIFTYALEVLSVIIWKTRLYMSLFSCSKTISKIEFKNNERLDFKKMHVNLKRTLFRFGFFFGGG